MSSHHGPLARALPSTIGRYLVVVLCLGLGAGAGAEVRSPRDLLAAASEQLITTLVVSGDAVRADPRFAWRLADETVLPYVDFERVGRRVLGKHWRRATPEQRRAYLRAFRGYASNFLVTALVTYSEEIASYADRVTFPPIRWRPGETDAKVRMLARLDSGVTAEVQYDMRVVDGAWRVFDVRLEGVSLVLVYRDTFSQEIKRHGLDGFIERLASYTVGRTS